MGLNADLRADLDHLLPVILRRLGGQHPVSSVFELAIVESKVMHAVFASIWFLPRGLAEPEVDPGAATEDGGALWRPATGLERGLINILYNDARAKLGLAPVRDG